MPAKIQHLVVLMLENRSFDHLLGFLKSGQYPVNGLDGTETNPDSTGVRVRVTADARYAGDLGKDPGHDFLDVNEQIFGNSQGTTAGPLMNGFVKNYQSKTGDLQKSRRIMKCFHPERVTVVATLAREYAVCDNWFSSVPGPTLPNRAFAHGGTSLGRLDMSPQYFTLRTVYQLLEEHNVTSKIYYHDWSIGLTVGHLIKKPDKFFGTFDRFRDDCKKNRLPAYSFVEPRYYDYSDRGEFYPATDQHPDHDVYEGELLIRSVYEAVRSNQQTWESTLLVIVYDEHGGLYDHVAPPAAPNPDGKNSVAPPFKFDRLGVRVPAVVVSPFIQRGTILRAQFDHASLIATAIKLFIKNPQNYWLTERDRRANTFEGCLTLSSPRTDKVTFAKARTLTTTRAARGAASSPAATSLNALSEFQRVMVLQAHALESTLPPARQTGINVSSIGTEQEAARYLAEVRARVQKGAAKLPAARSRTPKPSAKKRVAKKRVSKTSAATKNRPTAKRRAATKKRPAAKKRATKKSASVKRSADKKASRKRAAKK